MKKTSDYEALRIAIREGRVKTFNQIFDHIDGRTFFKECGMSPYQWADRRKVNPELFKFGECMKMAKVIGIDIADLGRLIENDLS